MSANQIWLWSISGLATCGIIVRPFGAPEAVWAVCGAMLLFAAGLVSAGDAVRGVLAGHDVYLFLTGMMLMAELARNEGLFDWLAARAAAIADGSPKRLFALLYGVGTLVTVFLSNDATAVVMTPAVIAVVRKLRAPNPLPYVLVCAFISNAASFVLPISNPANLVIYGDKMPGLFEWLPRYASPSLLSIAATFGMLYLTQRRALEQRLEQQIAREALPLGGRIAGIGIAMTAVVLMIASAFDLALGLPTFLAGAATVAAVLLTTRQAPWRVLKGVSWSVLPLVAGLFVFVEAMAKAGVVARLAALVERFSHDSAQAFSAVAAGVVALVCNVVNNLPAGLLVGRTLHEGSPPEMVTSAVLVAVDLGPNLSVTGSLATLLWLTELRRGGLQISGWTFLRLGAVVMTPALVLSVAAVVHGR